MKTTRTRKNDKNESNFYTTDIFEYRMYKYFEEKNVNVTQLQSV